MKKYFDRCFIFSLVFLFVSILSINSYAENHLGLDGSSGFGARVSYLKYNDDSLFGSDFEPDGAAGFGINYTYIYDYYISFEFSADYIKTDTELNDFGPPYPFDVGDLTQIPILITGRLHPFVSNRITPYFSAGLGYFFNHIDSNRNTAETLSSVSGARFDVTDSFAGFVGGGVEVFLSDNYALNLDLKYIWTQFEVELIPVSQDVELDVDPFVAGLGFKYYF